MVLYATRPKTLSPADPCNKVPPRYKSGMAQSNAEMAAVNINVHDVVLETAISSSMA
jgi:hypothetical protein